jgi:hypothetical protein
MAHGGARPGAGRKTGGANRLAQEAVEQAKETGEMPLDYLLRVMRDPLQEDTKRIDCAKAAAPYLHAKRAPIDSKGDDASGVVVIVNKP